MPYDKVKLHYSIKDNSYSEGNKMKYWQVPKDVSRDGTMSSPGDTWRTTYGSTYSFTKT